MWLRQRWEYAADLDADNPAADHDVVNVVDIADHHHLDRVDHHGHRRRVHAAHDYDDDHTDDNASADDDNRIRTASNA